MVAAAWTRGLWAPDEPRYAEVGREIFETGSWLVMHLCGELYPDKPPLLFWLVGATGAATGWSEAAMRVPSLLATLATAWLVGHLARRWWGEVEGRWAPALFLTLAMVVELGGRIQIDPLLTLLCTLGLVALSEPVADVRRRAWWLAGGGLALGLGALAKGPVAWLNVGLVLLLWRLLRLGEGGARPPRWAWAVLVAAAVGPVLIWALSACLAEPRLVEALFFDQHLGRITKADRHPGPPWKHLLQLPLLLLPWTLLVVAGLRDGVAGLWRRRAELDPGLARATVWLLGLLAFYSAIPPKRDLYLLPAYPAAALIAAWVLHRAERNGGLAPWLGVGGAAILTIAGTALIGVGVAAPERLLGLGWRVPLLGLPLVAGGVAAFVAHRRRATAGWARAVVISWAAFATVIGAVLFTAMDPLKSGEDLALKVAARPEKPLEIPCLGVHPEAYRFYGRVPAVWANRLDEALARDGDDFLAMVLPDDLAEQPAEVRAQLRVAIEQRVGNKQVLVVVRARPGDAPQ